jgi:hypothetical protein
MFLVSISSSAMFCSAVIVWTQMEQTKQTPQANYTDLSLAAVGEVSADFCG